MIEPPSLRRSDIVMLTLCWLAVSLPALLIPHAPVGQEAVIVQSVRELKTGLSEPAGAGARVLNDIPSPLNHAGTDSPLPVWLPETVAGLSAFHAEVEMLRGLGMTAGLAIVLLTGLLAARWFGRRTGLLAGLVTATTAGLSGAVWQSGLAIWIALVCVITVWMFSAICWPDPCTQSDLTPCQNARGRSVRIARFVTWLGLAAILVGVTNLLALCGVVIFLVRQRRSLAIDILSSPAWLLAAALMTCGASMGVLPGWPGIIRDGGQAASSWLANAGNLSVRLDRLGEFGQATMPWGLLVPCGLWLIRHEAAADRGSRERMLLCTTLAAPLFCVLFLPGRPELVLGAIAFWSIPVAVALNHVWLIVRSNDPVALDRSLVPQIGFTAAALFCLFCSLVGEWSRPELMDEQFLARVVAMQNAGQPIDIDLDGADRARVQIQLEDQFPPLPKRPATSAESVPGSRRPLRVLVISSPDRIAGSTERFSYRKILESEHRVGSESCLTLYEVRPLQLAADPRPAN